ncbi:MAG: lysine--tRNA ligase [Deltaproteobacteria bacterium]|nr:lysine--tRNA ligase [Deltaproteobacteria bacterium]
MSAEKSGEGTNQLIAQRRQKADLLRELGVNPYRNGFSPTHTAGEVLALFADQQAPEEAAKEPEPLSEQRFRLAGRIVEHRSFGKAAFIKLADRSGQRIQVYVKRDRIGEASYKIFKKSESWDFVGVEGFVFFTKTKELTVFAERVEFLTKTLRPPPEKWSGLKDQETRYRQRYVDLVANPEVAEVFRTRSKVIRFLRAFLDQRDFLEVETPILHGVLGGAAARPFKTHHNALDMPLYLRIAPELYLKRLVVGGFERVYEIGRVFRNEGLSRTHNPEFTMLEFYQAYATYAELIELTEEMLSELIETMCASTTISYEGQQIDFSRPWPRMTIAEAVSKASQRCGSPLSVEQVLDPPTFEGWIERAGFHKRDDALAEDLKVADSYGKRLAAIFDHLGEAELPADRPVFVTDYPAANSPLSRRKDDDPEFVDRFELFVAGREIANAFSELNDPIDQRQRFVDQLAAKARGDQEAMEYDEDYCRALEFGLPPTAGEGIGIDRLVMLICDQPSIRDVLLFPHMRPELSGSTDR